MARYGPPDDPNHPDDSPTQYLGQVPGLPPDEPVAWYRKPVALVALGAVGALVIALVVFGLAKLITGGNSPTESTSLTPITTTSRSATPTTTPSTQTATETTSSTTTEPTTTTTTTTTEPTTTTTTTTTESTTTSVSTSVSTSTSTSTVTQTVTQTPPA